MHVVQVVMSHQPWQYEHGLGELRQFNSLQSQLFTGGRPCPPTFTNLVNHAFCHNDAHMTGRHVAVHTKGAVTGVALGTVVCITLIVTLPICRATDPRVGRHFADPDIPPCMPQCTARKTCMYPFCSTSVLFLRKTNLLCHGFNFACRPLFETENL
jgi:hypothetical protein